MTLLEITLVILMLLTLIGLLFVGATAWKRSASRSGCIMNIRNAQAAVRAYQNVHGLSDGTPLDIATTILGPGGYLRTEPVCPGGGSYQPLSQIPALGELAITCTLAGSHDHEPDSHDGW